MKANNLIVIWGKKSVLNDKKYHMLYINKKHIVSIDLLDCIQINLVNGMIYHTFYDIHVMFNLGLMEDIDSIMLGEGFIKDNPDFDYKKHIEELEQNSVVAKNATTDFDYKKYKEELEEKKR